MTPVFSLSVHQQFELHNSATRQKALFEVLDLFAYRGQSVVYGERLRQGIWLPSSVGHIQAPPGPACFPIFPEEPATEVVALVGQIGSLPLYLLLPGALLLPLLTVEDAHLVLGGERGKRDDMVKRAQRLIDLYLEWKPLHVLPEWFRLKRGLVKARN
mgnify:FL=1